MAEYINKEVVLNNAVVGEYVVISKDIFDGLLPAEVVPLDRIKEVRKEIQAYYEGATNEKQKIAFNACLLIVDKLIAENEEQE